MNNYVIIDADKLKLRIEELENIASAYTTVKELKQVLLFSTPLIPEIEKAIKEGIKLGKTNSVIEQFERKQDYITNLKLNI